MPIPRFEDAAITLNDGSVLLAGGAEAPERPAVQTPVPATPGLGADEEENQDDEGEGPPPCPPVTAPAMRWVP